MHCGRTKVDEQISHESRRGSRGGEMGEFSPPPLPPLFLSPLLCFFLIPQILIGSITLLQKFTPHFKILDPRLER